MNDKSYLHPEFIKKLNKLEKLCNDKGIAFTIVDTYRTDDEQNKLYTKGRLAPGDVCTEGQYPNNYHCWGLAVNIKSDSDYKDIAKIAESIKLSWGGNSIGHKDKTLIEYRMESLKYLRLTYNNYKTFRLTWDPNYVEIAEAKVTESLIKLANVNKMFIENLQRSCNMDGFRSRGRILQITGELDEDTLEAFNKIKMKEGERYSTAKRLQAIFAKLGYKLVATGKYDQELIKTIKKFQISNNINPDGKISKGLILLMLSKA